MSGAVVEPSLELLAGFLERQGMPHGAKHLRQAAATITALQAEVAALREALEPFSVALGKVADKDTVRWPDDETLEHSGAAEMMTWGHLRIARAALERPQP